MALTLPVRNTVHPPLKLVELNVVSDGTTPSDIAEGTGSAIPSLSAAVNGAMSMPGGALIGVTFASLATVLSAFALLA